MARTPDQTHCHAELAPEALAELVRSLLADGLSIEVEVSGSSMRPFVRSGDVITLEPREPGIGDVAAVLDRERRLLVHRVVARAGGRLVTRGDAAPAADPPTGNSDVVGRVTAVRRGARSVRLGLGPGRRAMAVISRLGLLAPLVRGGARAIR